MKKYCLTITPAVRSKNNINEKEQCHDNTHYKRNPWSWIPTLYFAEGLPYVAVMTIAVIMYKRLGLSNTEIALYTSWLYLPGLSNLYGVHSSIW